MILRWNLDRIDFIKRKFWTCKLYLYFLMSSNTHNTNLFNETTENLQSSVLKSIREITSESLRYCINGFLNLFMYIWAKPWLIYFYTQIVKKNHDYLSIVSS
jgi:hypothetical protein